jgi:hypothetical protein
MPMFPDELEARLRRDLARYGDSYDALVRESLRRARRPRRFALDPALLLERVLRHGLRALERFLESLLMALGPVGREARSCGFASFFCAARHQYSTGWPGGTGAYVFISRPPTLQRRETHGRMSARLPGFPSVPHGQGLRQPFWGDPARLPPAACASPACGGLLDFVWGKDREQASGLSLPPAPAGRRWASMKCYKCGQQMHKRIIEPFGIKVPVTLYECRNALCAHDEDEYPWRRRFHERFR